MKRSPYQRLALFVDRHVVISAMSSLSFHCFIALLIFCDVPPFPSHHLIRIFSDVIPWSIVKRQRTFLNLIFLHISHRFFFFISSLSHIHSTHSLHPRIHPLIHPLIHLSSHPSFFSSIIHPLLYKPHSPLTTPTYSPIPFRIFLSTINLVDMLKASGRKMQSWLAPHSTAAEVR